MKAVLWISFYFMTFFGLIAGMYLSKERIVEETRDMPVLNRTEWHEFVASIDSTSPHLVDSLGVVMESLFGQMSSYIRKINKRDSTVQALKTELAGLYKERESMQKTIASLREANKDKIDQEKELQDVAKTLGSMKADVLKPILQNLPDEIIRIVYDKAKSKDRTKLLNSLAPDRAGRLMRKKVGKPSRQEKDAGQDS